MLAANVLAGGSLRSAFNGTAWSASGHHRNHHIGAWLRGRRRSRRAICAVNALIPASKTQPVMVNRFNKTSCARLSEHRRPTDQQNRLVRQRESAAMWCCFARGTDTALWLTQFSGGSWNISHWTAWGSLGGLVPANPVAPEFTAGQLACATVGINDGALWVDQSDGTAGWDGRIRSPGVGTLACSSLTSGKVLCTVLGVRNKGSSS